MCMCGSIQPITNMKLYVEKIDEIDGGTLTYRTSSYVWFTFDHRTISYYIKKKIIIIIIMHVHMSTFL